MGSRREDRRPELARTVLTSRSLTYGQKVFMLAVIHLAAELIEGKRRHGSKAMGPDGYFSLHLDYIARTIGTTAENAKKLRQGCVKSDYLSPVHDGAFGRPPCFQALIVRGEETYGVTFRQNFPPYAETAPLASREETSPLTYKTPDHPSHSPASGGPRLAEHEGKAQLREVAASSADSWLTVCEFHPHTRCPRDCRSHPANREASA